MPNSVLWVCLVAVWLFVLVPMVIKGRPQMLKTTDAAKATRLLHRGGTASGSTARRAAGAHPYDPSYKRSARKRASVAVTEASDEKPAARSVPTTTLLADDDAAEDETPSTTTETADAGNRTRRADGAGVEKPVVDADKSVDSDVTGDKATEDKATDDVDEDAHDEVTLDGEIVDPESDSDTSDLGEIVDAEIGEIDDDLEDEADEDLEDDVDDDLEDEVDDLSDPEVDEFENPRAARGDRDKRRAVDDYDELDDDEFDDDAYDEFDDDEYEDDDKNAVAADSGSRRRRRGVYTPDKKQIALKYRERQRVTAGLFLLMIAGIASGVVLGTAGWIIAGVTVFAFVFYLGYLRRAVAVEQKIRAQRMARAKRQARQDAERRRRTQSMEEFETAPPPPRLRRPGGATVLEIDDEDPVFDHLPPFQRRRTMRENPEFRQVG